MIQRFRALEVKKENLEKVRRAFGLIGFEPHEIRQALNPKTKLMYVFAYIDDEVDCKVKSIRQDRMEDYCVPIWNAAGYHPCELTWAGPNGETVVFGREQADEYFEG